MCFSATASFAASSGLLALGSYALYRHHSKKTWMLAAIPLFFGFQQAAEGLVWLTQTTHQEWGMAAGVAPYMFLFFAFFMWPVWMPLAVARAEGGMSMPLRALTLLGAVVAGTLAFFTFLNGVSVGIDNHHIVYTITYPVWLFWPLGISYIAAVTVPFFISSRQYMPLFGAAVLAACAFSYYAFFVEFTSVWCFFAALLSFGIIVILDLHKK